MVITHIPHGVIHITTIIHIILITIIIHTIMDTMVVVIMEMAVEVSIAIIIILRLIKAFTMEVIYQEEQTLRVIELQMHTTTIYQVQENRAITHLLIIPETAR
jgi:hypothetical protein